MLPVPGFAIPAAQRRHARECVSAPLKLNKYPVHSRITINTHSCFPVHPWLTHHFATTHSFDFTITLSS
ncbi:hypothetical protein PTI98_012631 [Pleurotus ostreatus]|nr:hypothetical protein PTI98_012631 [Pleurotus ostreatus]